MDSTEQLLADSICSALKEAVSKAKDGGLVLADMYVRVKTDDLAFVVYDDVDNVLSQTTLDALADWKNGIDDEEWDESLIRLLRGIFTSDTEIVQAFETLEVQSPFSVVLVDDEMEPLEELLTIDRDNIYFEDNFWEKVDKELDDFFDQLMSDVK